MNNEFCTNMSLNNQCGCNNCNFCPPPRPMPPCRPTTITVGTTTTGAPGSEASVTNVGTPTNAILNFTIPAGATGSTGTAGEQGEAGPAGEAATIEIGTVTTGEAGTEASVTNAGTNTNAILNFTIPRGESGDTRSGDAVDPLQTGAELSSVVEKVNELINSLTEAGFLR